MPVVKHKYKDLIVEGDEYIGRGSLYGNPFIIGIHGDRATVCDKYEKYWCDNPILQNQTVLLKGKDLVCFCAPLRCHGDFLLRKANES